ncbi:hypothetical protein NADFUDRAFT_50142 [Nadsonia fulvescens var. elongata DSM 6958]|uniref:Uncharacterized protein n=1 Tax=Nadsonia fulvescens var. elongata DSM 6958 TaxID=857566 RepID=A0A1E3PLA1_9ASCO|nr:hypothetical protein NADFUDRAFT_50142 [Nadsonia fulvescens var. elongata DSM 6958]
MNLSVINLKHKIPDFESKGKILRPQRSSCVKQSQVKQPSHLLIEKENGKPPDNKISNSNFKEKGKEFFPNKANGTGNPQPISFNENDHYKSELQPKPTHLSLVDNSSSFYLGYSTDVLTSNKILVPLIPLMISLSPAIVGIVFGVSASVFISDMVTMSVMCWLLWGISEGTWSQYQNSILKENTSKFQADKVLKRADVDVSLFTRLPKNSQMTKKKEQNIWEKRVCELPSSEAYIIYILSNFFGGLIMLILRTQLSSEKKLVSNFNIILYIIIGLGRSLTRANKKLDSSYLENISAKEDPKIFQSNKCFDRNLSFSNYPQKEIGLENHLICSRSAPPFGNIESPFHPKGLKEIDKLKYESDLWKQIENAKDDSRIANLENAKLAERINHLENMWEQEFASIWSSIDSVVKDIEYFSYVSSHSPGLQRHNNKALGKVKEFEINENSPGKEKKGAIFNKKKHEKKRKPERNSIDDTDNYVLGPDKIDPNKKVMLVHIEERELELKPIDNKNTIEKKIPANITIKSPEAPSKEIMASTELQAPLCSDLKQSFSTAETINVDKNKKKNQKNYIFLVVLSSFLKCIVKILCLPLKLSMHSRLHRKPEK